MEMQVNTSLVLRNHRKNCLAAEQYFENKLHHETDIADLAIDLRNGVNSFILADVRSFMDYQDSHIPGAISIPSGNIPEALLEELQKDKPIIVYCWGPACNGAAKAAAKLSRAGYSVKELLGGIEYWIKEVGGVEGLLKDNAPMYCQISGEGC